jgi:hypothetical protein
MEVGRPAPVRRPGGHAVFPGTARAAGRELDAQPPSAPSYSPEDIASTLPAGDVFGLDLGTR